MLAISKLQLRRLSRNIFRRNDSCTEAGG